MTAPLKIYPVPEVERKVVVRRHYAPSKKRQIRGLHASRARLNTKFVTLQRDYKLLKWRADRAEHQLYCLRTQHSHSRFWDGAFCGFAFCAIFFFLI